MAKQGSTLSHSFNPSPVTQAQFIKGLKLARERVNAMTIPELLQSINKKQGKSIYGRR